MLSAVFQEGTVVDAEDIDDAGRGFIRVFFGPPSTGTSPYSGTLDSAATDSGAQADDQNTWRVPLASLRVAGFKRDTKVMLSDPD